MTTRNPAVAGMADRTAPVVKLTRQKIVIPSGIGLAAVLAVVSAQWPLASAHGRPRRHACTVVACQVYRT